MRAEDLSDEEIRALHEEYGVPLPTPAERTFTVPPDAPRTHGWWLQAEEWADVKDNGQQAVVVARPTPPEPGDLVVLCRVGWMVEPTNYWLLRAVTHVRTGGLYLRPEANLVSLRPLKRSGVDSERRWNDWLREVAQHMAAERIQALDTGRRPGGVH